MPNFNVMLKDGASESELEKYKQLVKDQGGKIVKEFSIVKGFTAEVDPNKVTDLVSNEHVEVEQDKDVGTW